MKPFYKVIFLEDVRDENLESRLNAVTNGAKIISIINTGECRFSGRPVCRDYILVIDIAGIQYSPKI